MLVVACTEYMILDQCRSGGEIFRWAGTGAELHEAIARGDVRLFDGDRCRRPFVCPDCGARFVTGQAEASHYGRRHGTGPHDQGPATRNAGTW